VAVPFIARNGRWIAGKWWLCFTRPGVVGFPPEPPVAVAFSPERTGAVQGAPVFGAAKRTLDREDRSGIRGITAGGSGGKPTFPAGELRAWS
jgi:hypothetical protein